VGDFLSFEGCETEKRNFYKLIKQLENFEKSIGTAYDRSLSSSSCDSGEVEIRLGPSLRATLKFHVG